MHIRLLPALGLCALLSLLGCKFKSASPEKPAPSAAPAASREIDLQPASSEAPPKTSIRFSDVTAASGVDFTYQNGGEAQNFAIVESLGGGVAQLDFDLDGRQDLLFPGGGRYEGQSLLGHAARLYRAAGDWKFIEIGGSSGIGAAKDRYTHGAIIGDFDHDGFPDALITGYGGLQLWRNQGDGTFVESAQAAGLEDSLWSTAAAWADFNSDGLLDLYIAHYVNWSFANNPHCSAPNGLQDICPPKVFQPLPDSLYLNAGDGTFRNHTQEAGLRPDGKGLGVVACDLDLDGDIDIYVANDTTDNFLYYNKGNAVFEESGGLSGAAVDDAGVANGSMGVDVGDYNRDGLPDLWVANFEVESFALYRNDSNGLFLHVSRAVGVTALGGLFVGFGTSFADLDRDGDEDIVVTNGHVINFPRLAPLRQLPLVLINDRGRRLLRLPLAEPKYLSTPHAGRGLAVGDLDDDGDLDLAFSNNAEPAALLRNDSTDQEQWLRVRLIGQESNRNAIGATLWLEASGGTQLRIIKGGGSYLSQNDLRPLFGIPSSETVKALRVRWPSGKTQTVESPSLNATLTLLEPTELAPSSSEPAQQN